MVIKMLPKNRNQVISIILFICCAMAVSWGIFRSIPPQEVFPQSDKVLHVLAFCLLAFTGKMAMPKILSYIYWPIIVVVVILMEYIQGALQITRTSSVEDALANLVGVVLAFVIVKLLAKISMGS
jgi:VanZ family protein